MALLDTDIQNLNIEIETFQRQLNDSFINVPFAISFLFYIIRNCFQRWLNDFHKRSSLLLWMIAVRRGLHSCTVSHLFILNSVIVCFEWNILTIIMMTEEEPTILQNTCHDVGIDYDDILKSIGPTGKYSRRTFIPLIISSILPGMIVMSYTFTTAIPEYRYVNQVKL